VSFIILLSFYLDEILPEEDLLEERVPFKKTLRAITLAPIETIEKNEPF